MKWTLLCILTVSLIAVGVALAARDNSPETGPYGPELKEVKVWGFYTRENTEEIPEAEKYLRRYLEDGESIEEYFEKQFGHLRLGEERYGRSGQRFCRHVTDEETKSKHPVINPNLRVRLYDREWNVLSEDFLRDDSPENTKETAYTWYVIAYVPYHKRGHQLRVVRLENGKEIFLARLEFHSIQKLYREIKEGKFYAYMPTADDCFLSPPLR